MGMYDLVVFEMELPDLPLQGRRFQTKFFDCCMDVYTVTRAGRLCLTGNDLFGAEYVAPPGAEVDIDFHGDIRLVSEDGDEEYLARFTHGVLEWIRPWADTPMTELALRKANFQRCGNP